MSYEVLIRRRATKQLAQLPLRDSPRPQGCLKLTGRAGWRIRVGDYRVIYEVDDPNRTVTVLDVGNRRDVYN